MAGAYARHWERLTTQSVQPLLDATLGHCGDGYSGRERWEPAPHLHLLDVCTGPGFVAEAAAERGATVVALDISEPFLALAAARCSGLPVATVAGDACELTATPGVAEAAFDAVTCNFGILHLPDPGAFLAGCFRVLRPGGTLGFSVWAPPPATAVYEIMLSAIDAHGDPGVQLPPGPPFFEFADPGNAAAALTAAGFAECSTHEVPQTLVLDAAADLWPMVLDGTARTRALLLAQPTRNLDAIRAAVVQQVIARFGDGQVSIPMPSRISVGTKPDR